MWIAEKTLKSNPFHHPIQFPTAYLIGSVDNVLGLHFSHYPIMIRFWEHCISYPRCLCSYITLRSNLKTTYFNCKFLQRLQSQYSRATTGSRFIREWSMLVLSCVVFNNPLNNVIIREWRKLVLSCVVFNNPLNNWIISPTILMYN